jgi:hypothetical protein
LRAHLAEVPCTAGSLLLSLSPAAVTAEVPAAVG